MSDWTGRAKLCYLEREREQFLLCVPNEDVDLTCSIEGHHRAKDRAPPSALPESRRPFVRYTD